MSLIDAVICSIALACSVEPCASDWLALATCSEPVVTCADDSLMLERIALLSFISLFKAFPRTSLDERGTTETVRLPCAISVATCACSLVTSTSLLKSSTKSPNSSLFIFSISTSTSPRVSLSNPSVSNLTGFLIAY